MEDPQFPTFVAFVSFVVNEGDGLTTKGTKFTKRHEARSGGDKGALVASR